MTRTLIALLLVAAAAAAGAFFVGNPGQVEIVWQGWRIDTSVGVLVGAAALFALIVAALALLLAALRRAPRTLSRRRAERRRRAGEAALTRGLVALAADDAGEARRHATRARLLLPDSPTGLLLAAEAAQRQGDAAAARDAYAILGGRTDGEFLGLRGLLGQALRAGDDAAARPLAERARRLRPDAPWLADSLIALAARAGDWPAVQDTLAQAGRRGALTEAAARRGRGIALFELSRRAEREGELRRAAGLAARAQALAPGLAPAAAHHARLLVRLGRRRTAARVIERAWRAAPHPELARCYGEIAGDDNPLERAAAVQRLADRDPGSAEARLAAAEAALAAALWGEARRHLDAALAVQPREAPPPRRWCLAMAKLAEHGSHDAAAARDWLDRAIGAPSDPTYVCRRCAAAEAAWQPVCPRCGAFDTLSWQVPEQSGGPAAAALPAAAAPMLPAPEAPRPGLAAAAQSDN